jgi:hypothetical protein
LTKSKENVTHRKERSTRACDPCKSSAAAAACGESVEDLLKSPILASPKASKVKKSPPPMQHKNGVTNLNMSKESAASHRHEHYHFSFPNRWARDPAIRAPGPQPANEKTFVEEVPEPSLGIHAKPRLMERPRSLTERTIKIQFSEEDVMQILKGENDESAGKFLKDGCQSGVPPSAAPSFTTQQQAEASQVGGMPKEAGEALQLGTPSRQRVLALLPSDRKNVLPRDIRVTETDTDDERVALEEEVEPPPALVETEGSASENADDEDVENNDDMAQVHSVSSINDISLELGQLVENAVDTSEDESPILQRRHPPRIRLPPARFMNYTEENMVKPTPSKKIMNKNPNK